MPTTADSFPVQLLSTFARQAVLGFGLLLVLGALIFLVQRWSQQLLSRAFGWKLVIYSTGWLGTPVHEMSHALVGWVWPWIKVDEIKLFEPDPKSGVLGYVRYSMPRLEVGDIGGARRFVTGVVARIGAFFLGVAPLFGGSLVLLLAAWLLLPTDAVFASADRFTRLSGASPPAEILDGFVALVRALGRALGESGATSWRTWLFLYIALCVGNHLAPSRADLEGGLRGFVMICGLVLAADTVLLLLIRTGVDLDPGAGAAWMAAATGPLSALLLLALVGNLGILSLAALSSRLGKRLGTSP